MHFRMHALKTTRQDAEPPRATKALARNSRTRIVVTVVNLCALVDPGRSVASAIAKGYSTFLWRRVTYQVSNTRIRSEKAEVAKNTKILEFATASLHAYIRQLR